MCVEVVDAVPLEPPNGWLLVLAAVSQSRLAGECAGRFGEAAVWVVTVGFAVDQPQGSANLIEIVFVTTACENVALFVLIEI